MEVNMQFIELLKAVILGIIEGVTEWLPVSSTGHLIIFGDLLGFGIGADIHPEFSAEFAEMFNVVIQLGAILAVIVCFFGRLNPWRRGITSEERGGVYRLWLKVCVASIPAAVVGLVLDKVIEKLSGRDIDGWLYNSAVVAAALIIYGVLFILIEHFNKGREARISDISEISYKNAFLIGVFQMLAIVPGTSRSGSTILGSMLIGVCRTAAAEFSFFMAIPAMLGASLIKLLGFFGYVSDAAITVPATAWLALLIGSLVSFLVSMVAIKFLMEFVRRHSFSVFGIYRIVLGALVLGIYIFS